MAKLFQHGTKMIPKRLLTLVLLVVLVIVLLGGGVQLIYNDAGFTVKAGVGSSYTVNYADVSAVEWYEGVFTPGLRTFGKSDLRAYSGQFSGGSLDGEYRLYLEKNYPGPSLIITVGGQPLVIGSANIDMEGLYLALQAKL